MLFLIFACSDYCTNTAGQSSAIINLALLYSSELLREPLVSVPRAERTPGIYQARYKYDAGQACESDSCRISNLILSFDYR